MLDNFEELLHVKMLIKNKTNKQKTQNHNKIVILFAIFKFNLINLFIFSVI